MRTLSVCLSVLLLLGGCSQRRDPEIASSKPPIRIGRAYWPGQYWVDVALTKGWFAEEGVNVSAVDTDADYMGSLKDVAEGRLDTQLFVLFDLVRFNDQGAEIVMVMCNDYSWGADAIVARKPLQSLQDLVGKRVGVPKQTSSEYLLHIALEQERINPSSVTIVDIQGEKAADALASGEVDAVCTWTPHVEESAKVVDGVVLWDSTKAPAAMPSGYAIRRQLLLERPDEVAALVRVWHRATQFIEKNPQEAYAIVAAANHKPVEEVARFAKLDRILSRQDNLLGFSFNSGTQSLHSVVRHINAFMVETNLTTQRIDSTRLFDATYVRALQ
jgi:NitT/TauT family transport system substrate-binding protein